jgi:hypothetical protein
MAGLKWMIFCDRFDDGPLTLCQAEPRPLLTRTSLESGLRVIAFLFVCPAVRMSTVSAGIRRERLSFQATTKSLALACSKNATTWALVTPRKSSRNSSSV